jgi:hypothetical protein
VGQALRPFPQYTGFDHDVDADTTGHSTYHAFSISTERRFSSGLWFTAYYTFSKLISNVQGENPALGTFIGNGDIGTQNAYDRNADKAISNQDVPHHVVLAYAYELPVGKGKRVLSNARGVSQAVLGGWKVSGVHNYQSGYPLRATSSLNIGLLSGTLRANYVGGQPMKNPNFHGDPNATPYINPAAFVRPAPFTFGNSGLNLPWLRTPALIEEDISLGKDFALASEARRLEFKASAFNIANRVQFGGVSTSVDDSNFGKISSQANTPREIQFSLRFTF